MTTTQARTDEFSRHCFQRLRIEILIADFATTDLLPMMWRSYRLVSRLLRVPSHPPDRSVLVDFPELHLAPMHNRILPLSTFLLVPFFTLASLRLASVLPTDIRRRPHRAYRHSGSSRPRRHQGIQKGFSIVSNKTFVKNNGHKRSQRLFLLLHCS
jgi:hypothetical protein